MALDNQSCFGHLRPPWLPITAQGQSLPVHVQSPEMHASVRGQTRPHAPQFELSPSRLTQLDPQRVYPGRQPTFSPQVRS